MHTQKWCGYQSEIQQHSGVHIFLQLRSNLPNQRSWEVMQVKFDISSQPWLWWPGRRPMNATLLLTWLNVATSWPIHHCRGWFVHENFWKQSSACPWKSMNDALHLVSTTILLMGSDSPWSLSAISAHAPMMLHFRNPATCGTYKQESFMGCMSTFCSHGARAARLSEPSIKWYGLKAWKKAKSWQQACLFHFIFQFHLCLRNEGKKIAISRSIPDQYHISIRHVSDLFQDHYQIKIRPISGLITILNF